MKWIALAALAVMTSRATAQQTAPVTTPPPAPAASADPYAKNADGGKLQFPFAAAAGQNSGALARAPAGTVNSGAYDNKTWKYGPAYAPRGPTSIWNPVVVKLKAGDKVTGGTVFSATDPETYCAMANAGYDFIWTEMQHSTRDWNQAARMWAACPYAKAVPGVRISHTDEREVQHALDAGELVIVIPTVDTAEEAREAVKWVFWPPLGRRSAGGGKAFGPAMWGSVPGGYRQTANDNIVLIVMIETLEGLKNAAEIAKVPGVTAVFAASGDLANFTGFTPGSPDCERAINIVHDATIAAGKRLCWPLSWRDRPDLTCFQAGSETANIARGAAAELGPLANTQGVVTAGPLARK